MATGVASLANNVSCDVNIYIRVASCLSCMVAAYYIYKQSSTIVEL